MLRSLYASVSGLRNHQLKMDVLGNNIANVNTIGFKSGRVNFSEALNQMISNSYISRDGGYLDPMQIGLGMKANSIDTMFNQGAVETTGNLTDLAIAGDGFFVVRKGSQNLLTRVGTFQFDAEGKLVSQSGLAVQGWMLNGNDNSEDLGVHALSDLVIDRNMISEAVATRNVYLAGNLNADLGPVAEVWTSGSAYLTRAVVEGATLSGAVNIVAGTNDQFTIEITNGSGLSLSEEITLNSGTYATVDDLVAEINNQIAANTNLNGRLEAVNANGAIKFRSLGSNSRTEITLRSGTNDALADLGFSDGDSGIAGETALETTELNDLLQTTDPLVAGDVIRIVGTNPDGSTVDSTFTYGSDGTTVGDLLSAIRNSYSGVDVSFENGKIVLTDTSPGESQTTIRLLNGDSNTGQINASGFFNTVEGTTGKVTTSVVVYDSQGGGHNLVIEFVKTENSNEWTWQVTTNGDETILSGGSGTATFDENGKLLSFTTDGGVNTLEMDPGNGAAQMSITLHAENGNDYAGLTQYNSSSSLAVREQDGRTTGKMVGLTISQDGTIVGSFSNGENVSLARIALARVANNNGLINAGDGSFNVSIASGEINIFSAKEDDRVAILSGALEMSNVDLANEFTEMITTQRGFEANAKVISTVDQILEELIRLKR